MTDWSVEWKFSACKMPNTNTPSACCLSWTKQIATCLLHGTWGSCWLAFLVRFLTLLCFVCQLSMLTSARQLLAMMIWETSLQFALSLRSFAIQTGAPVPAITSASCLSCIARCDCRRLTWVCIAKSVGHMLHHIWLQCLQTIVLQHSWARDTGAQTERLHVQHLFACSVNIAQRAHLDLHRTGCTQHRQTIPAVSPFSSTTHEAKAACTHMVHYI